MSQERTSVKPKRIQRRKTRMRKNPSQDLLESETALLQHQIGNRALHQAIVQRELAAGVNPLDPNVMGAAAQAVIAASETPVRNWLTTNIDSLRLLTMDQLVAQVRRNVAETSRLADVEIQRLVRESAAAQNIRILEVPGPGGESGSSIQIPDAVKKAFSIPIDGVDLIKLNNGRMNISAKGATAKLKRGNISVGWTGSLGIDIPIEGFQFTGTLDKEKWEMTLSIPGESYVPDLAKLAEVFQKGETAMRDMLEATAKFPKLEDIPKLTKAISPHVEPIKDTVKTLVDIAKSPKVSAGIKLKGPVAESAGSSSGGITVTATVTIRF